MSEETRNQEIILSTIEKISRINRKDISQYDGNIILRTSVAGDKMPDIQVCAIIESERVDLVTVVYYKVKNEVRSKVLELINSLNMRLNFVTFYIDDSSDLMSRYTFNLFGDEESIRNSVTTGFGLYAASLDECIPAILSLIWNEEEENRE